MAMSTTVTRYMGYNTPDPISSLATAIFGVTTAYIGRIAFAALRASALFMA